MPSHRYVRTPDSPPPSIGYVEGLLEVMASFEGMILRRETMLSSHDIQVTPLQTGPSEPSPAAGREIQARGRGRRRVPARRDDDDESSEDEEPVSPQSKSSKGGGDGTSSGSMGGDDVEEGSEDGSRGSSGSGSGLDSGSGADGNGSGSTQPRKRMKRASQS